MDPSTKSAFLRKTRIFAVRDTFFRRVAEKGPAQGRLGAARARDPKISKKSRKTCWSMSMVPDRSVPGPVKKSPRPPGRPGRVPAGCPGFSKGKRGPFRYLRGSSRLLVAKTPPALVRPQPNASGSAHPAARNRKISQFWRQGHWTETLRFPCRLG